jgi:hypothetical protein
VLSPRKKPAQKAAASGKIALVSFIRSHPFWTLLIVTLVLMALSYVLFVPGHGSGGMDLGPIQPDK